MFLEMHIKSKELGKRTQVNVLLPNDGGEAGAPFKTLWLLHGLSDDHTAWMRNSDIARYASRRRLAVIMPAGDRSWYSNTAYGMNYFDYLTRELPAICRATFKSLSERREDQIIAGLSMGGYGALKAALTYPERYGACISLSGAVDVTRKGRPSRLDEWRSIFGFDLESPLALQGSEHDLMALASRCQREGATLPRIYMWCGEDDSLLSANRELDAHLTSLGVGHHFGISEGDHTWPWWALHIGNALDWVLDGEKEGEG